MQVWKSLKYKNDKSNYREGADFCESRWGDSILSRSWDIEAGWFKGGGDGVAAGEVCSGTSSGIPDISSNIEASQLLSQGKVKTRISTCDVCPKKVCQMQSGCVRS